MLPGLANCSIRAARHSVVLVGERRAEEGHDPVAHHLVDRALVAVDVDGLHHPLEHRVEDLSRLRGISVGEQLHAALQVGEEDGDLLALTLERALGGEDFLGEVLGGVCVRGGRTTRGRGAATPTEAARTATRASRPQTAPSRRRR